jgi:predicted membrane channel-forming protein YqfA (hemolysin III family)
MRLVLAATDELVRAGEGGYGSTVIAEHLALVAKPRLRGLSHAVAFVIALPLGLALVLQAETARGRLSAIVFAAAVVAMFGAAPLPLSEVIHVLVIAAVACQYSAVAFFVLPEH